MIYVPEERTVVTAVGNRVTSVNLVKRMACAFSMTGSDLGMGMGIPLDKRRD
jgi:hypothetical protein